jgi:chromosome segregation ATPase
MAKRGMLAGIPVDQETREVLAEAANVPRRWVDTPGQRANKLAERCAELQRQSDALQERAEQAHAAALEAGRLMSRASREAGEMKAERDAWRDRALRAEKDKAALLADMHKMLAACELALPLLEEATELVPAGVPFDNGPAIEALRVAIAKAKEASG